MPALVPQTNGHSHSGHTINNGHTHTQPFRKPDLIKDRLDGFSTRAIHVGSEPDSATGAVIPPLTLSTTFKQDEVGVHKGYEYARSSNPNRAALETLLASLESGGAHGLTFASGSATTATVLHALGPNAHVVSVNDVYGGTRRYMTQVAGPTLGMEVTFVDMEAGLGADGLHEGEAGLEQRIRAAIKQNTKMIWVESPTNPTLRLIDIPLIARIARSHPARPFVLVDNTFLSPFYTSPLLQGADIVIHSMTKYINGHSDVLMGCAVLPSPSSPSSHPLLNTLIDKLRFLQNALGAVPSPHDCYLAQRGAKTLAMRMKTHGLNALRVAQALKTSPYVKDVIYPGLRGNKGHAIAWRSLAPHARGWVGGVMRRGRRGDWEDYGEVVDGADTPSSDGDEDEEIGDFPYGGMISFRLKPFPSNSTPSHSFTTPSPSPSPSPPAQTPAQRLLPALRLFTLAESLGGVESLASLPCAMTHASVPRAERELLGIGEDLVRLSVGCEEGADLVRDLEDTLERVYSGYTH
jgi:cystathionine gamma-lyase